MVLCVVLLYMYLYEYYKKNMTAWYKTAVIPVLRLTEKQQQQWFTWNKAKN